MSAEDVARMFQKVVSLVKSASVYGALREEIRGLSSAVFRVPVRAEDLQGGHGKFDASVLMPIINVTSFKNVLSGFRDPVKLPAEGDICKYLFYDVSRVSHIYIDVYVKKDGEVEASMRINQQIGETRYSEQHMKIDLTKPSTAELLVLMCLDRAGVLDSVARELGAANAVLERVRDVLRSVYTAAKILMQ
jgi:hypothetical protein